MSTPILHRLRQKGTVLITVMLMVAVAAFIASEIAYRQQMDILRTGAFLARDAASNYLMAAEELGLFALRMDRENDDRNFRNNGEQLSDHLGEEWNKPGAYPLPDGLGTIEGRLIDLQSRFNVNSLVDKTPQQQVYISVFDAILNKVLQEHPEAFAEGVTAVMLRERVIDWIDADQTATGFDGMEDDDYFREEYPYRTANHFISDPSELLLVKGFTPLALRYLEDKLSFLPPKTKINLYTADKELLTQLGFGAMEVAEFVDRQRPRQVRQKFSVSYNNLNEVYGFLAGNSATNPDPSAGAQPSTTPEDPANPQTGKPPVAGGSALSVDMFDIKSHFFLLKGRAVVNGKPVLVESVIWKPDLDSSAAQGQDNDGGSGTGSSNGTATQTIPVTTIFRKFVDPLKQTN